MARNERITVLTTVGFLGGVMLLGAPANSQGPPRQASHPASAPAGSAASAPAVAIAGPTAPVLGGATFTVRLGGEPGATWLWEFGYRQEILAQGRVVLDADGRGLCRLVAPKTRHRVACTFLIQAGGRNAASKEVVIYPAGLLATVANRFERKPLGLIDPSGRVAAAFEAEKVAFHDLRTQLQQDSFEGGMVILAGFSRPEELADHCRKLRGRLEKGMAVVILNPPAGWQALDIRSVEVRPAVGSDVTLADGFSALVQGPDLGTGPWSSALESARPAKVLGWFCAVGESPADAASTAESKPAPTKHPVLLACPVKAGWVVVGLLPEMEKPADAVAQALVSELIFWTLQQSGATTTKEHAQ